MDDENPFIEKAKQMRLLVLDEFLAGRGQCYLGEKMVFYDSFKHKIVFVERFPYFKIEEQS